MNLDLTDSLTVHEVATACRATPQTVYRWITTGVVIGGNRVKLAAVRVGGNYAVRPVALELFIAACNPAATPPAETPAAYERRAKAAQRELAARLGGGS